MRLGRLFAGGRTNVKHSRTLLKRVAQGEKDPAIPAVGGAFVKEIEGGRASGRVRDAEVAMVGQIEHIRPELEIAPFGDLDILPDVQVDTDQAVGAQEIAWHIAYGVSGRRASVRWKGAEKDCGASGGQHTLADFRHSHLTQFVDVDAGCKVRPDRNTDQRAQ